MFDEKTIKEIESGGGRESITAEEAFCELAEKYGEEFYLGYDTFWQ